VTRLCDTIDGRTGNDLEENGRELIEELSRVFRRGPNENREKFQAPYPPTPSEIRAENLHIKILEHCHCISGIPFKVK
jgi:hypothetical protein